MKKFFKELFQQSFCKNGKIHPPYIYIWTLLITVLAAIILRFFQIAELSDVLILGLCGNVLAWIGVFNIKKDGKK